MKKFIVAAAIAASMGAGLGLASSADAAPYTVRQGPHQHVAVFRPSARTPGRGLHVVVINIDRDGPARSSHSFPGSPSRVVVLNRH